MVQEDLDILLYRWLSEPDEHRAEQQFTRYFQAAFPAICRYLRSLHADPATAQDLAQQALIKLFNHLGTRRRAADEHLREALGALRPLEFGALHTRQVQIWRSKVTGYRDAAVNFRVSQDQEVSREPWKETREEINGRVPTLSRQALHFLDEVRSHIGPRLSTLPHDSALKTSTWQAPEDSALVESAVEALGDAGIEQFLTTVFDFARGRNCAEADTTLGYVGVVGFLTCTTAVRSALQRVAIPSNGILYIIAKRQLLDQLIATRHQSLQPVEHLADSTDDGVMGVFDAAVSGERDQSEDCTSWVGAEDGEYLDSDVEARYRAFLEFLRAPLTRAEGLLAAATTKGKAKAEQARVESLRTKSEGLLSVLRAMQQDPPPTEEQIARRQGLSRNQVKYVIERIRKEFNHFFPDLVRQTDGRRRRQSGDSSDGEALGGQ